MYCTYYTVLSLSGQAAEEEHEFVVDISYSVELHGLAMVTSSGKVAFITGQSARFQPEVRTGS